MSTKNLARTVIEGGRSGCNKFERNLFTRIERRKTRRLLQAATYTLELAEEIALPIRKKAYVDQNDKLNPVRRWLQSQCGKHWNSIHSKIFRTFETRTIAGQHIVYDHMLGDVATIYHPENGFYRFLVDKDGVLTHQPYKKSKWQKSLREYKHIRSWLNGRYIGRRNNCLYWFVLVDVVFWDRGIRLNGHKPAYRQDRRLTLMEENVFFALSRKARNELFEEGGPFIPNLVMFM